MRIISYLCQTCGICRFTCCVLSRCFPRHYLPPSSGQTAETSYQPFIFFAGFSGALAGILGFAVQGKGQQKVLVGIYSFIAAATIVGICWQLCQREVPRIGKAERGVFPRHVFRFGQWTLVTSTLLSIAFAGFAFFGLFPGQKVDRVAFEDNQIEVTTDFVFHRLPANISPADSKINQDKKRLDRIYRWMFNGCQTRNQDGTEQMFLWIEQRQPFDRDYQTFAVRVDLADLEWFAEPVAFLVSQPESGVYRPQLRQLRFRTVAETKGPSDLVPGDRFRDSNILDVEQPNRGEWLRILLVVRGSHLPENPDDFSVHLERIDP